MSGVGAIFRFLAELLGFANRRQDLKNTEPMQAAARAQAEQAAREREIQAVAEKDADAIRRNLSE